MVATGDPVLEPFLPAHAEVSARDGEGPGVRKGRNRQDAHPPGASVVHVSPGCDQMSGRSQIPRPGREHQRPVSPVLEPTGVLRMGVGWRGQELTPNLRAGVDVRTVLQENRDDVRVAIGHRPHEGRLVPRSPAHSGPPRGRAASRRRLGCLPGTRPLEAFRPAEGACSDRPLPPEASRPPRRCRSDRRPRGVWHRGRSPS